MNRRIFIKFLFLSLITSKILTSKKKLSLDMLRVKRHNNFRFGTRPATDSEIDDFLIKHYRKYERIPKNLILENCFKTVNGIWKNYTFIIS